MKQKIEKYLGDIILERYSDYSPYDLVNEINEITTKNQGEYEEIILRIAEHKIYTEFIFEIYGIRDETDEEYIDRMLEEERDRERIEEEEKKKRLQRFKLYQELKKEFENETNLSQ